MSSPLEIFLIFFISSFNARVGPGTSLGLLVQDPDFSGTIEQVRISRIVLAFYPSSLFSNI